LQTPFKTKKPLSIGCKVTVDLIIESVTGSPIMATYLLFSKSVTASWRMLSQLIIIPIILFFSSIEQSYVVI